jgi:hypothetical protein
MTSSSLRIAKRLLGLVALLALVPGAQARAAVTKSLLRTCPGLRDVPAHPEAAGGAACSVLTEVDAALTRSDDLSEEELTKLRADIASAVASSPATCVPALGERLTHDTTCGIVYDAVAVRILTGANVPPDLAAAELARASSCQWKLVSSLREATSVSPSVLAVVSDLTTSSEADVRASAWLTLGTLERIARTTGQGELAHCAEQAIASELEASQGAQRRVLVSAAGNAGCNACRATLDAILADDRQLELQRSAAAAYRFLDDRGAVDTMCKTLQSAHAPSVRGAAAYALRHQTTFVEARYQCLFRAATEDPMDAVTNDAIASIEEIAEATTEREREIGIGMLVRIERRAPRPKTRARAIEALRGFASDDALVALLPENGASDPNLPP